MVTDELKELRQQLNEGLIDRAEFDELKALVLAGARAASDPPTQVQSGEWKAPEEGATVGAYRLLDRIGQGGMGTVYRARHRTELFAQRQGGDVAVKIMHPAFARSSGYVDRFEQEGAMGLSLDHPGIVRVHQLVVDAGTLGLVMELVEGRSLARMIGEEIGPLHWNRARPLCELLLSAVGHAHGRGVVHRDLKPDNVMVEPGGVPKILDFGIAKELGRGRTRSGMGMGTVDYMAPEQYTDASNVDRRADIYALGLTIYEMLAGRLPWEPTLTEFEVQQAKLRHDLPPPTAFYPDIPGHVVRAVMRATAVDREERFGSTGELWEALREEGEAQIDVPEPAVDLAEEAEEGDPAGSGEDEPTRPPGAVLDELAESPRHPEGWGIGRLLRWRTRRVVTMLLLSWFAVGMAWLGLLEVITDTPLGRADEEDALFWSLWCLALALPFAAWPLHRLCARSVGGEGLGRSRTYRWLSHGLLGLGGLACLGLLWAGASEIDWRYYAFGSPSRAWYSSNIQAEAAGLAFGLLLAYLLLVRLPILHRLAAGHRWLAAQDPRQTDLPPLRWYVALFVPGYTYHRLRQLVSARGLLQD